MGEMA